ncbi:MAG: GNAT family N-acetyltransferase [Saprospiraceae bacterium]
MEIHSFDNRFSKQVSELIRNTLREINSKDYSEEIIEKMCTRFSEENITNRASNIKMVLMIENEEVIGTASLKDNIILTVFVSVNAQGKGVGTKLMRYLEEIASKKGFKKVLLPSSITSVSFYKKLGYKIIEENINDFGKNIIVEKVL